MTTTQKKPTKKQIEQQERAEACDHLREILKPGDTVYTVLRHVSSSGMQRRIDLYVIIDGEMRYLSGYAAIACDLRMHPSKEGIVVGGCGMDMGFHLVYELSHTLWPKGYDCIGENCASNDHSNGDRERTPHHHRDGGYALRQRWL